MDERFSAIWEKIKSFFGAMSKTTKILIAVVLVAILIIFFARWVVNETKPYEVAFYGLTDADLATVSKYLLDNGVEGYKIEGTSLLGLEGTVDQLRAMVYAQGLPNSGGAYETYNDMVGAMSTDTDKEIAYLYDLQKSMEATIRKFDGVFDADVQISKGEDRSFVLDTNNFTNTTASVMLTLEGSTALNGSVISAIRLAVSHGVADLDIAYVSVVDTWGNTYSDLSSGTGAITEASYAKLQLEEDVNNRIRSDIMLLLNRIYGVDNINISVNSTVDIDRKISSATEYPTPEYGLTDGSDARGIIGTEVFNGYAYGSDGTYIGGVVGATPNSDFPVYPADTDGDGLLDYYGGSSGQIDYMVPETVTQKEQVAGVVTDVTIGITINSLVHEEAPMDVDSIVNLVAITANIPLDTVDEKVSVYLAPFILEEEEEETNPFGLETWMWFAILAGIALFLIVLIVIIILVKKKKREEEEAALAAEEEERRLEAEREAEEIAALAPVDGADIMDVNTEKSMELRKDLRTFVGDNPEIAATLLRNLMKGGEVPDAS